MIAQSQSSHPDTKPSLAAYEQTEWDRRHDQAYRLLQMSLPDAYKALTFDCLDLPSTWRVLTNHFESKAAADILNAEAQLEQLRRGDNQDVFEFLNSIRLIRSTLLSAGEAIPDRKLFLTVIKKLPNV